MTSFYGKLTKRGSKLLQINPTGEKAFDSFKTEIPEGRIIEVYMQVQGEQGLLSQLAKVHVLIRALSAHIGDDPARIKNLVKDRAGLCLIHSDQGVKELFCKSFGDCSYQDLNLAIQAAIDIGKELNLSLQ